MKTPKIVKFKGKIYKLNTVDFHLFKVLSDRARKALLTTNNYKPESR